MFVFLERIYLHEWVLRYDSNSNDIIMLMEGQWRVDLQLITKINGRNVALIMLQGFVELKRIRMR